MPFSFFFFSSPARYCDYYHFVGLRVGFLLYRQHSFRNGYGKKYSKKLLGPHRSCVSIWQNCAATRPVTQQQSTGNKLELMWGLGRGRCAVVQILTFEAKLQSPSHDSVIISGKENYKSKFFCTLSSCVQFASCFWPVPRTRCPLGPLPSSHFSKVSC